MNKIYKNTNFIFLALIMLLVACDEVTPPQSTLTAQTASNGNGNSAKISSAINKNSSNTNTSKTSSTKKKHKLIPQGQI
jgi:hypothetical protein